MNKYRRRTEYEYQKRENYQSLSENAENGNKRSYHCPNCGWASETGDLPQDHCPNCLVGIHEAEDEEGIPCGGMLEPVGIWAAPKDSWEIIQRCTFCKQMRLSPMADRDNLVKVLSIASKPLSSPPFPLERIKELAKLTGVRSEMRKSGDVDHIEHIVSDRHGKTE